MLPDWISPGTPWEQHRVSLVQWWELANGPCKHHCCDSSPSRSTAGQCSGLLFPSVDFVLEGVAGWFFCLTRKDFNANLRPYLALAVKPERRQGAGGFYSSGLGKAACGAEGAWGSSTLCIKASWGQQCGVRCRSGRELWQHSAASGTAISPTSPPWSM